MPCFCCRKLEMQKLTYIDKENISDYCSAKIKPDIAVICSSCNLSIIQLACFERHKKSRCKQGYMCLECNRYISVTTTEKTTEAIKENHRCDTVLCTVCFTNVQHISTHICKIAKCALPVEFSNLAFFSIAYEEMDENSSITLRPMLLCCIHEHEKRESFVVTFITENCLRLEHETFNCMNFSYFPYPLNETESELSRTSRTVNYGEYRRLSNREEIFNKLGKAKSSSFLNKIVQSLICDKFQSFSFIASTEDDLVCISIMLYNTIIIY